MNARFWTWDVFDNFTWDHGATVLAAAIGALITVGLAVWTYLVTQAAARRDRQAAVYAEALRAVEDYLEGPYRIRRRDGSAEQRAAVTTWLSDVKSRHNYYQGLIRLHASARVADAYDGFVAAAIADAGPQMTHAWRRAPTRRDREVPLGSGYDRSRADVAKAAVIVEMERSLAPRWRRWAVRS
ncbi:hypothetical protein [uncultured Nocardioides sp.]|uniref:hypothetical protein n=1 Tax=uncultured Nocardioides sp. TaxID=198441 RepID=UPI002601CCE7|nr:hypothetical protein [uncultured Nocardioides sp.]